MNKIKHKYRQTIAYLRNNFVRSNSFHFSPLLFTLAFLGLTLAGVVFFSISKDISRDTDTEALMNLWDRRNELVKKMLRGRLSPEDDKELWAIKDQIRELILALPDNVRLVSDPVNMERLARTESARLTAEEVKVFRARLEEIGPLKTWAELKQKYQLSLENDPKSLEEAMNLRDAHGLAHLVGHATYTTYKDGGMLLVCDSSANYGCYHGFFEAMFPIEGLSAVNNILKSAEYKNLKSDQSFRFGNFAHGIGHGIQGYVLDLKKTTEICNSLSFGALGEVEKNAHRECVDGAFMEYYSGLAKH